MLLLRLFFLHIKLFNLVLITNITIYSIKKTLYLKLYKYPTSTDEVIFDFERVKIRTSIFDDVRYKFARHTRFVICGIDRIGEV